MPGIIPHDIRCSALVRAEPEKVYDGIATAAGLDAWFTSGAEVDPHPGGTLLFRWRNWGPDHVDLDEICPILEAERPRCFVFQWSPAGPEHPTTVEIDFEQVPEGTVIRLREHGYPDTDKGLRAMLDCAAGWGEGLVLWKFSVEHNLRY